MAYVTEHHCITIFAQDQWKRKFKTSLNAGVKDGFWRATGHADCHVCCTCEICRGLSEMFDPLHASEYNNVCNLCLLIHEYFKKRLGGSDGLILMAHWALIPDDLVTLLFQDKHIKKVFVLNHTFAGRPEEVTADSLKDQLQQKSLSRTDYLALEPKEDNVVYEIIRDEYLKAQN
jgi:hypothetical protein